MILNHALAASTFFIASTVTYAAPSYQLAGAFEDGGSFSAVVSLSDSRRDICPADGIGCFGFDEVLLTGEYSSGTFQLPSPPNSPFPDSSFYQLRSDTADGRTIDFVFGGVAPAGPEWVLVARFEYLASGSLDAPWDGSAAAIGSFLGGSFDEELGFNSPISSIALVRLVPEPASASLAVLLLGASATANRRK